MAVGGFRGPLSVVWEPDGGWIRRSWHSPRWDTGLQAITTWVSRNVGWGQDGRFLMVTGSPVVNGSCHPLKARCPSNPHRACLVCFWEHHAYGHGPQPRWV